ncbi:hypothetical protein DV737_g2972, partial [Chaetothyriales sp. CBS 132003]
MTAAFLISALTGLITDSRKRFNDVRSTADNSLSDLKSIAVTSESQLAADLARRPAFVDPFLHACHTKNAKLALNGAACLQRLVASRAVPKDRLHHLLGAYSDAVDLTYEVQLKILQTLPALLQLYGHDINDNLLARLLDVCASLSASRTSLVASSATATLDQLVDAVFERAVSALQRTRKSGPKGAASSDTRDDEIAMTDASRLLRDFCILLHHGEPDFLQTDRLSSVQLLRLLEKLVDTYAGFIRSLDGLVRELRTRLLPAIEQLLSSQDDFLVVAHCTRLTYVLLQKLPSQLVGDATPLLGMYLGLVERDSTPPWKRVVAAELFRSLLSNFPLLMRTFEAGKDQGDNIVTSLMAAFVRIAAENPTLIGMGRQSTMPVQIGPDGRDHDLASIEAQGIGGGGLATVTHADASATGIGRDFSTLERPLIDAEESAGPSHLPDTYIYTLILNSISALCDGLSKFVMPLSVAKAQSESGTEDANDDTEVDETEPGPQSFKTNNRPPDHKYQRLVNPLKINQLPQLPQLQICARLIDHSWPAILATSSTFLNAALDSHFYHILIRSMQKLAQVSGLLDLKTPRDALLTSLAKASVPANAGSIIALSQHSATGTDVYTDSGLPDGLRSPGGDGNPRSGDIRKQSLNIRHLLCLRALLNLGIALGPSLGHEAWFIFVETLQQVEALMSLSVRATGQGSTPVPGSDAQLDGQTSLAAEIAAMKTASRRMFESTRSYPDQAFTAVSTALFRLIGEATATTETETPIEEQALSPAALSPLTPSKGRRAHRPSRSVSGLWVKTKALDVEVAFVLTKAKDLARINLHRFASPHSPAWSLIAAKLLEISQNDDIEPKLRLEAAEILDLICLESIKILDEASADDAKLVQTKSLELLLSQITPYPDPTALVRSQSLHVEIAHRVFDTLEDILGHCGDSLDQAWPIVFALLQTGVQQGTRAPAFRCVQLICNDFLSLLSPAALERLVALMAHFGCQDDTNMALTTASLLRSIAALLHERADQLDLTEPSENARLWFSTVRQLSHLCVDVRPNVRDASVRVLVQSLDASIDKLSPPSWHTLLYETFITPTKEYLSNMQGDDAALWEATCSTLTEASTKFVVDNIVAIAHDPSFRQTWQYLVDVTEAEIKQPSFQMYATAFNALAALLEALSTLQTDCASFVTPALVLWEKHTLPMSDQHLQLSGPNQAALEAHASMLDSAHTASSTAVSSFFHEESEEATKLQKAILNSILSARHSPYTDDVRKLSSEQELLLRCITILRGIMTQQPDRFIDYLLDLLERMQGLTTDAAKPKELPASKKWQKPSYMALSSTTLELLRQMVREEGQIVAVDLPRAFRVLASLINFKYTSVPSSQEAPLWKAATVTAVTVTEALKADGANRNFDEAAETLVELLSAILGSGGLQNTAASPAAAAPRSLLVDEDFDIAHFNRFHASAVPLICLPRLPDTVRKQYALVMFRASLLAKPREGDFPDNLMNNSYAILKNLNTLRRGSVRAPIFVERTKVAYAALDALFALVNPTAGIDHPSAAAYHPVLAKIAFPLLLLRIAHPIRAFLADQPLRGLTPFPLPQQAELWAVLTKALQLKSDDVAFAEARHQQDHLIAAAIIDKKNDVGVWTDGKSHLRALYGLVLRLQTGWRRMMRLDIKGLAWQDGEEGQGIEEYMDRWIGLVAEGWQF